MAVWFSLRAPTRKTYPQESGTDEILALRDTQAWWPLITTVR